jgi:hypothetical protein
MIIPEIKDVQGRTMEVNDFIYDLAWSYGWKSVIADESLAQVMNDIRSDGENTIGAGQSINGAIESEAILEFCGGGSNYNPICPPKREWLDNAERFPMSGAEMEAYYDAIYTVAAIIPAHKTPVLVSYTMTQDELEDYLENYDSFGEFIVAVRVKGIDEL